LKFRAPLRPLIISGFFLNDLYRDIM